MNSSNPLSVFCVKNRFGYVLIPTSLSIVYAIERFGYASTPTPVSDIPIEGEYWLYEHF